MAKMNLSERGLMMIQKLEGFRPCVYFDEARIKTIGFGHVLKEGEKFDMGLTRAQAVELFMSDIVPVEKIINRLVWVPITQTQYDALVSFTYNVGTRAFDHSTLLRMLNAKQYENAASEFLKWNKIHFGGAVLESYGLTKRRETEAAMFREGISG